MKKQYYVLGFRFDEEKQKVVLIKKLKPDWQKGKLNGVGGKIEPGETAIDAMVREFQEETGLKTKASEWNYKLTLIDDKNNKCTWIVDVFYSIGDISKCKTVEKEKVVIANINKLPKHTIFNLRWQIPLLLDTDVKDSNPVRIKF